MHWLCKANPGAERPEVQRQFLSITRSPSTTFLSRRPQSLSPTPAGEISASARLSSLVMTHLSALRMASTKRGSRQSWGRVFLRRSRSDRGGAGFEKIGCTCLFLPRTAIPRLPRRNSSQAPTAAHMVTDECEASPMGTTHIDQNQGVANASVFWNRIQVSVPGMEGAHEGTFQRGSAGARAQGT
jgi:hypothetical protein